MKEITPENVERFARGIREHVGAISPLLDRLGISRPTGQINELLEKTIDALRDFDGPTAEQHWCEVHRLVEEPVCLTLKQRIDSNDKYMKELLGGDAPLFYQPENIVPIANEGVQGTAAGLTVIGAIACELVPPHLHSALLDLDSEIGAGREPVLDTEEKIEAHRYYVAISEAKKQANDTPVDSYTFVRQVVELQRLLQKKDSAIIIVLAPKTMGEGEREQETLTARVAKGIKETKERRPKVVTEDTTLHSVDVFHIEDFGPYANPFQLADAIREHAEGYDRAILVYDDKFRNNLFLAQLLENFRGLPGGMAGVFFVQKSERKSDFRRMEMPEPDLFDYAGTGAPRKRKRGGRATSTPFEQMQERITRKLYSDDCLTKNWKK